MQHENRVMQKRLSLWSLGGLSLGSSAISWQLLGFYAQKKEENLFRAATAALRSHILHVAEGHRSEKPD